MALRTCLLPSKGSQQGGEAVWRLRIEETEGIITNKQITFICTRKKHALLSGLLAEVLQGFPGLQHSPQTRECRRRLLCPWAEEVCAGGPELRGKEGQQCCGNTTQSSGTSGVSMPGLFAASSGSISLFVCFFFCCFIYLWCYFFQTSLFKPDCSGLFRQQNNLRLSLAEAEGCLLLWVACFVLSWHRR